MRVSRVVSLAVVIATALVLAGGAFADPAASTSVPFTFGDTNPCTGDAFTGTGFIHSVMSANVSTSGMVRFHFETNLESLQAVTLTGVKYVVPSSFSQSDVFDTDGEPAIETLEFDLLFVRVGEDGSLVTGDDFHVHFLAHITVNENGLVTADGPPKTTTRCD